MKIDCSATRSAKHFLPGWRYHSIGIFDLSSVVVLLKFMYSCVCVYVCMCVRKIHFWEQLSKEDETVTTQGVCFTCFYLTTCKVSRETTTIIQIVRYSQGTLHTAVRTRIKYDRDDMCHLICKRKPTERCERWL